MEAFDWMSSVDEIQQPLSCGGSGEPGIGSRIQEVIPTAESRQRRIVDSRTFIGQRPL